MTSGISDWVSVVDLRANAVTDNIMAGTRPERFLLIHDGQELWVSNKLSGQISIIDRATNQVTGNLGFRPPHQIDVTPVGLTTTRDTKTAFVTLGRADRVAFLDTATRKVERYVPVGADPSDLALSDDEKTLYVVNRMSDDVSVVDVLSGRLSNAVPVGRAPYSIQIDN